MPPESAAAEALPAAEQPAEVKNIPFAERWAAAESKLSGDDTDEATDTEEAPAEKPAAKPSKAAPPGDAKEAKREQLRALAEELGLTVDDSSVSVGERAEWRRAKAREQQRLQAERAEWEKAKSLTPEDRARADLGTAIQDAVDRGDPEAFAKALKFDTFNDFQTNFLKRLADPNYMELQRLQKEVEGQKAEREKAEKEARERAAAAQRAEVRRGYMQSLSANCKNSKHPLVAAMADYQPFLDSIFEIQKEHWDDEKQQTIPVEMAIKKAIRGGADLETNLKQLHERLSKGFAVPEVPASAQKLNGKKPAPKTAVVPAAANPQGGAPKSVSDMTPKEWAEYKRKKFEEAEG